MSIMSARCCPGETVELWSAAIDGEVPPGGAAVDYPGPAASSVEGFAFGGRRPAADTAQAVFRAELRLCRGK